MVIRACPDRAVVRVLMSTVRPRMRRALSPTAERVGQVIRQLTVDRVRPWLREVRTVHVARGEADLAPLTSWRGVGAAEPPAGPEPPVAPLGGGVVPPGLAPPPAAWTAPAPLSAAVVVPAAVLSATVSVALRGPPAFGVNTRPTWQDSPGATGAAEQDSESIAKSACPASETPLTIS